MMVTVRVYVNRIEVSGAGTDVSVPADLPYSTTRLLVGDFFAAEQCLQRAMRQAGLTSWWRRKPRLKMVAMAMSEGGLSPVEERVLLELGSRFGRDVRVCQGPST